VTFESMFGLANTFALAAWTALILAPRWRALMATLRFCVIGLFCVAYASLAMIYVFRVDGGGFGSLHAVQTLFVSAPIALAGWLHYLAFDLFVGLWIAEEADARGLSRFIQAPILLTTFMFGPVGLLLAFAANAAASPRLASFTGSR
jgi:hypothetical protein